ncbi:PEPxxWA-CTERM sorting domain-containing protein [Phenylobacterium sp.]|uniref:PEPxxWA-CTERM sorting domain-containing protein n=1 Tax=Phenylobacterium sp. TaxID=1871053 RepID=UPI0025E210A0|nr:PEPxxWA-CTERM sorting domain-containing protein [Phenylobacterium sp.]MBX3482202.1 PEPxxWA-CTERM sorting domain-containing protein [Phenylobacterium sp.]
MRSFLAAAAAAIALAAGPALADVTYTFKAAPTDWEPFDFSFTTSDFLGAGDPFSFAAFTINHGDDSFEITHGATTVFAGQGNCFLFATAGVALNGGDGVQCGLPADYAPGEAAFWFFTGDEFLPSSVGLYTDRYVAVFGGGSDGGALGGEDFVARLNITGAPGGGGVPEPGAWALMILGFGMAGGLLRRSRAFAAA